MPPALGNEEHVARSQICAELAGVDDGRGVERRRVLGRRRVARDRRVWGPEVYDLPPDDVAQVVGVPIVMERRRGAAGRNPGRDDGLEPSLRARFKDMQKIGEGTYGVARQRSKTWEAWRGEWHRGFWRLVAVLGG